VSNIDLFADVQITHGRFDVNLLLPILGIVVGTDAASGKNAQGGKQPTQRKPSKSVTVEHGKSPEALNRVVLARVHADINQREAGSVLPGLESDDVLVPFSSNLQLDRIPASADITPDWLGGISRCNTDVEVHFPRSTALDGLAILLQFLVVVSADFVGSIVGDELRSRHFQRVSRHRKIHIGVLLVAILFRSRFSAGIERQTDVADVGQLADMQIPHRRLDVNVLLAILAVVVRMDAASGKNAQGGNQHTEGKSCDALTA